MAKHFSFILLGTLLSTLTFGQYPNFNLKSDHLSSSVEKRIKSRRTFSNRHQKQLEVKIAPAKLLLDSIVKYGFNEATDAWDKKIEKESYTYDLAFKNTENELSFWDDTEGEWSTVLIEKMSYDEQGNLILLVYNDLNDMGGYDPFWKDTFVYNNENRLVESLYSFWSHTEESWVLNRKNLLSYNSKGKILENSTFIWNIDTDDWMPSEKMDYLYWPDDTVIHYTYKAEWDKESEEWNYLEHRWYNYVNLQRYSIFDYMWSDDREDWELFRVRGHSYDDNSNMISHTTTTLDLSSPDKLKRGNLETYHYDYEISGDRIVYPYWIEDSERVYMHHKVNSKDLFSRNLETKEMDQYGRIEYYYSSTDKPTNISGVQQQQLKLYPNPSNGIFRLGNINGQIQSLCLYDITGKLVFERSKPQKNETFDLSALEGGLYNVVVKTPKEHFTTKIIKR